MTIMMQPVSLLLRRLRRVLSYHRLTLVRWDSDSASSGFRASSITIRSAPLPVSTPPTEVAILVPCWIVAKSWSARRSAKRVGNSRRYQALDMSVRQSRANLSAKSWP